MQPVQTRIPFSSLENFSDLQDKLPSLREAKSDQQIRIRGSGRWAQIYVKEPRAVARAGAESASAQQYQRAGLKGLSELFVRDLTTNLAVSKERAQWIFGHAVPKLNEQEYPKQILVGHYRTLAAARHTIEALIKSNFIPAEKAARLVSDAIRMRCNLGAVNTQQLLGAAAIIRHRPDTPLTQALKLVPYVQQAQGAIGLDRAGALVGAAITVGKSTPGTEVTSQHLVDACAYMQAVKDLPADVAMKVAMKYQATQLKLAQDSRRPDIVNQLFKGLADGPVQEERSFIRVAHDLMSQHHQLEAREALELVGVAGKWPQTLLDRYKLSLPQVQELLAAATTPEGDFNPYKLEEAAPLLAGRPDLSVKDTLEAVRHSAYDRFKADLFGDPQRALDLVQALKQLNVSESAINEHPATRTFIERVINRLKKKPELTPEKACESTQFPRTKGVLSHHTRNVAARTPPSESKSQGSPSVSAAQRQNASPADVTRVPAAPKSASKVGALPYNPW